MSENSTYQGCKGCDYEKNAPDGICTVQKASDGFDIRCVGKWAEEKYYYIGKYLDIFSLAMKDKWDLFYIDLFAGCGKCKARETGKEINGSALMALNLRHPFRKYFFVDLNVNALSALRERIKGSPVEDRVTIKEGDCNEKVDEIIKEIPDRGCLCLSLIDPTGLHIKFETIKKLTQDRRIDLILTFPEGMAIKRNLEQFLRQDNSLLDSYIGDKNWRQLYKDELSRLDLHHRGRRFIDLYREKLKSIGYREIKSADEILIKSSEKKLPLYYLLFASKHALGHNFWSKIREIEPSGQQRIKFNNPSSTLLALSPSVTAPKLKIHYSEYFLFNGKKKDLVKKVNDGSIITRFDKTPLPKNPTDIVCPHFLELKWAYGCPFDCAWCYLKGTFRFRPEGPRPAFKPLEKVKSHVEAFLNEVDTPEILNTGEISDSLMGENGNSPFSKFIISLFEKQSRHKILFVTKSANIKYLLKIPVSSQVVMSFSLNALPVAEKWEKRAPKVIDRIEASRKVSQSGYENRIRIDPMVPVTNWRKHYMDLIDLVFSSFVPDRITLGSLRGLQSTINGTNDTSWVKYLSEGSNWGKKVDFNARYWMYLTIINYLKEKYNYTKVALCKETKSMWEKLDMDYREIHCNCIW
ncbi:MAG: three-Cys-motif partner protein TcmP [Deltaproteobacteria bacterium]|nr:three-Cys-motif partner protein TcmP [Deltaproteobacteria bacterium]